MKTRQASCRGTRVSWFAAVSAVTLLAALAISVKPGVRQNFAGGNQRLISNSYPFQSAGVANRPGLMSNYGKLPLRFEANEGQAQGRVKYTARGRGYTMSFAADEAILSLSKASGDRKSKLETRKPQAPPEILRMKLAGGNAQAAVRGIERLPGITNYYIGNDPAKWRTNVPSYAKVQYEGVYPGIDLIYYGNQRQLEYDFIVAPGVDPDAIALTFEGAKNEKRTAKVDVTGDLVITTSSGEVRFRKPVLYQEDSLGSRKPVQGSFALLAENRVGFEVGAYDKTKPLVIDPSLAYSTYFGGTEMDSIGGVVVDASGNAFIAGTAGLNDLTGPTLGSYGGGFSDAFAAELNPTGTAFIYLTYVGGDGGEDGAGIAFDTDGGVIVTGSTDSTNFPMGTAVAGGTDAYIFKLDTTGALQGSRIFGGTGNDGSSGVVVDANGTIYFTGPTTSTDLTITNGFQNTCSSCVSNSTYDAFVAVYGGTGPGAPTLTYSSYLGGDSTDYPHGLALDPSGAVWVVGETVSTDFPTINGIQLSDPDSGLHNDAFLAAFDATQTGAASLLYSSYLGGDGDDAAYGIAVDGTGDLYIIGSSDSSEAPVGSTGFNSNPVGFQDVVVTKFHPSTNTIIYYGLLGGTGGDTPGGIAVDGDGAAYVTGNTNSSDFPMASPVDNVLNTGGNQPTDAFVAKIAPDGMSVEFSSYLGGADDSFNIDFGTGIAVDASKNIYVVGQTDSATGFPLTAGVIQNTCLGGGSFATCADGFVTKISPAAPNGPDVSAAPTSLNFGDVAVNTTSTKTVTLTNTGNQSLTISNLPATWITSDAFLAYTIDVATTTCVANTPIAAAGTCDIGVTFSPTGAGTYNMLLQINSDALTNPSLYISTTGKGVAAGGAITATPSGLAFGSVVKNASSTKVTQIKNTGTASVTLSSLGFSGADAASFAFDGATTTCTNSSVLAVDGACNVGVKFTPAAEQAYAASLDVGSDANNAPTHIPLSGTGIASAATIDVSPAALDFGTAQVGSIINYPVTVSNTGTDDLILSSITVSGANAANFISPAAGTTCAIGAHIAPDASCVITTDFHSTAVATFNATLTINSNAANFPSASGPLTGKGSDFFFGVQEGGSTSDTVKAGETAVFNLRIGGSPGAAGTATLSCTANIPNATCGVQPASVVLNDTTPSNFIVSVATTPPTVVSGTPYAIPSPPSGGPTTVPAAWIWVAALAMMLSMMAAPRRKTRLVFMAAMLFVALWSSCVGNSPRAASVRSTPAGTYPVTVNATVNGVTKSQVVTVTVN